MVHIHKLRRKSPTTPSGGDERRGRGRPPKNPNARDNRRPFNTRMDQDILIAAQHKCLNEHTRMNTVIEKLLQLWIDDKVELP